MSLETPSKGGGIVKVHLEVKAEAELLIFTKESFSLRPGKRKCANGATTLFVF